MNRPFDEDKYQSLLDGLEISEVEFGELEFSFRLDAEYYQKEFIAYRKSVLNQRHNFLGNISTFVTGPFGSAFKVENYEDEEAIDKETDDSQYRYIRGKDVKPFVLQDNDNKYIPKNDFERLKKYAVKENDILVSVVGTLGNASIVQGKDLPAIFSCKSTILRNTAANPYYLLTYLNSKQGRELLLSKSRGAVQTGLNLDDLKSLVVPIFSLDFQNEIERLIKLSQKSVEDSKRFYQQAENELLEEIGLYNFLFSEENFDEKYFSESFLLTGRLDAEFYQPKYVQAERLIKQRGFALIKEICSDINYGTVPTSPYTNDGSGIPYIKGMNLRNGIIETKQLDRIVNTEDLPEKFFTKKDDIIISQMGTVGNCGVVSEKQVNWLFASFTIRIRLVDKRFNPIFLGFYIDKVASEYYLHRYIAQASVRQNTDLPTIKNMFVPLISISKQTDIADLLNDALFQRNNSEKLLEIAKQAVETAIEENEERALDFVKEELRKL